MSRNAASTCAVFAITFPARSYLPVGDRARALLPAIDQVCPRDLVAWHLHHLTVRQPQPDTFLAFLTGRPEQFAFETARAIGENVVPLERDLTPREALEITRTHERALQAGRRDLDDVTLGQTWIL